MARGTQHNVVAADRQRDPSAAWAALADKLHGQQRALLLTVQEHRELRADKLIGALGLPSARAFTALVGGISRRLAANGIERDAVLIRRGNRRDGITYTAGTLLCSHFGKNGIRVSVPVVNLRSDPEKSSSQPAPPSGASSTLTGTHSNDVENSLEHES
jgi:hypothetical protein